MIKKIKLSLIFPFIISLLILFGGNILYTKASSLIISPSTINIALSNIPQNTQKLVIKLNYDPAIIKINNAYPASGLGIVDPINKVIGVVSTSTALPENFTITLVFDGLQLGSSNISIDSITDTFGGQVIPGVNSAISTGTITVSEVAPTPSPNPTIDPVSIPDLIPSEVELTISNIPSGSKEISVEILFGKLILIIKNGVSSTLSSIKANISQPFSGNSSQYDYQTIKITNASSDLPESVSIKLSLGGITFGGTLLSISKIFINGRESSVRNASLDHDYIQVYKPDSSPYIASTSTPTPSPVTSVLDQSLYVPDLGSFFSMIINIEESNLLKGSNTSIEFSGYNALDVQSVDYIYSDSTSITMIHNEIIKDTDLSFSLVNINIPSDASDSSTLRFNLANGDTKEFMINTINPVSLEVKRGKKILSIDNPIIDKIDISNSNGSYIFKISGSNFVSDKRLFFLNSDGDNVQINNKAFSANSLSITPISAMAAIDSIKVSPNGKQMLVKVLNNTKPLNGFINIVTPAGAYSKKFSISD